jgi:hypothetical protein
MERRNRAAALPTGYPTKQRAPAAAKEDEAREAPGAQERLRMDALFQYGGPRSGEWRGISVASPSAARRRVTVAGSCTMASRLIRPWHWGQATTSTAKVRARLPKGSADGARGGNGPPPTAQGGPDWLHSEPDHTDAGPRAICPCGLSVYPAGLVCGRRLHRRLRYRPPDPATPKPSRPSRRRASSSRRPRGSCRTNVLERGGSGEAMTLYVRFRGKEPSVEPLLEKRGLK